MTSRIVCTHFGSPRGRGRTIGKQHRRTPVVRKNDEYIGTHDAAEGAPSSARRALVKRACTSERALSPTPAAPLGGFLFSPLGSRAPPRQGGQNARCTFGRVRGHLRKYRLQSAPRQISGPPVSGVGRVPPLSGGAAACAHHPQARVHVAPGNADRPTRG